MIIEIQLLKCEERLQANAVYWIVNAMMIAGVLEGVILVVFKIVSGEIALNREQDCGI